MTRGGREAGGGQEWVGSGIWIHLGGERWCWSSSSS